MINEKVKDIITAWDPINLFDSHVPLDEYDDEIKEIKLFLYNGISKSNLATKIYQVFMENYGNDVFTKTLDECMYIANLILSDNRDE